MRPYEGSCATSVRSGESSTVNGNFALPDNNWLTLADWQADTGYGWDADSQVGGFSANCPAQSLP